ncbi:MAG: universal stress protein [Chloroflexales bacterium]
MKTILVPLDGSPFGEHALPAAIAVARKGAARLALAHVHQIITPTLSPAAVPFFDPNVDTGIRDQEAAYLEDIASRIASVWDGPISQAVLNSPIAEALCMHAQDIDAKLIVLSSHGRGGIARSWMGSVTDRVIRQSKLPTLVVRPTAAPPSLKGGPAFAHILIPLDGSPLAEQAIALADQIIGPAPAHYDLVRVVEPVTHGFTFNSADMVIDADAQEANWEHATDYLEGLAAPLRARGHVVMTYVPIGHPASAILERASADAVGLIAMTTHGRGGLTRMIIGSVADKVLRGTTAPLLIYRPPLE